jgi:hypothetical protein
VNAACSGSAQQREIEKGRSGLTHRTGILDGATPILTMWGISSVRT